MNRCALTVSTCSAGRPATYTSVLCSTPFTNRTPIFTWLIVLLVMLALAGCGPARGESARNQSIAETQRIALDYAANPDVERARAQLQTLDVANANQWLLFVAEDALHDESIDAGTRTALVTLARDMGLSSAALAEYEQTQPVAAAPAAEAVAVQGVALTPAAQLVMAVADVQTTGSVQGATDVVDSASPTTTQPITAEARPVSSDVVLTTTAEAEAALPTPTVPAPQRATANASTAINLRTGPGTEYPLAGGLQSGEAVEIVAKNQTGDWWQIRLSNGQLAWAYGALVQTSGPVEAVAVASDIPAPPVAAPTVVAAAPAPAATAAPTAAAVPTVDASGKPYFRLVKRRMLGKEENGTCRGQHLLHIDVIDANGIRLNGVRLRGIYTGEIMVTGSQGKGDGVIEYDLYGSGEGFMVINDTDGRDADSDHAEGFTTRSLDIDVPTLIGGGYCTDEADCQVFYASFGCNGHHSWEATFQRNY